MVHPVMHRSSLQINVSRATRLIHHMSVLGSVQYWMVKPPLNDGDRHLWIVQAEITKFSPRPVMTPMHWRKYLGGSVPVTDGGVVSAALKDVVCDAVNGTHSCASGMLCQASVSILLLLLY